MIKQAEVQNAYIQGRQAAMEKLAYVTPLALVGGGALANYLGKQKAVSEGKKDTARMSTSGVLAPLGYGALLAAGGMSLLAPGVAASGILGARLRHFRKEIFPLVKGISNLGLIGGGAYGLTRAYKKPGEYKS